MHYGSRTASCNRKNTMEDLNGKGFKSGTSLTEYDIKKIRMYYGCEWITNLVLDLALILNIYL